MSSCMHSCSLAPLAAAKRNTVHCTRHTSDIHMTIQQNIVPCVAKYRKGKTWCVSLKSLLSFCSTGRHRLVTDGSISQYSSKCKGLETYSGYFKFITRAYRITYGVNTMTSGVLRSIPDLVPEKFNYTSFDHDQGGFPKKHLSCLKLCASHKPPSRCAVRNMVWAILSRRTFTGLLGF